MNERYKELAQKAYEDVIKNTPSFLVTKELYEQKFAELIVQECIHALWTEECRTNAMTHADYERSGQRIHKHFWG